MIFARGNGKSMTQAVFYLEGLYFWIYEHCPNRRVAYLMVHGKNCRIRNKNLKRACDILKDTPPVDTFCRYVRG